MQSLILRTCSALISFVTILQLFNDWIGMIHHVLRRCLSPCHLSKNPLSFMWLRQPVSCLLCQVPHRLGLDMQTETCTHMPTVTHFTSTVKPGVNPFHSRHYCVNWKWHLTSDEYKDTLMLIPDKGVTEVAQTRRKYALIWEMFKSLESNSEFGKNVKRAVYFF